MSEILLTEQATSSITPTAGRVVIYAKTDGYLYFKNDSGTETRVNPQTVATEAEWAAANPVLPSGVFGVESDTQKFKIGDGATAWNSLTYWRYTAEHLVINTTGGDTTLTIAQARASSFAVTGTLVSNVNIIVKNTMALFVAENLTTGAFTVTFKTAAGTGVAIPQASHVTLYADGVNVELPTTAGIGSGDVVGPASSVNGKVALFSGTTGKLLSDSGVTLGTAAANNTGDFDAAGLAATAETNAKSYADTLVVGLWDDRGVYDASVNTFPASGGSGTAGAIMKGDVWTVSVAGALGGVAVNTGDIVRALVNTPGQTASNWALQEGNLGYTPENVANKVTSISGASTDTQYPSAKLAYDQLALKLTPAGVGSDLTLARIAGSTYSTIQHWRNNMASAGVVSGGVITDAGGGNINVSAGSCAIRPTASHTSTLYFADFPASLGLVIPANTIRYVGVEYNAGTPIVAIRATDDFDYMTNFPVGAVTNEAGALHIHLANIHDVSDAASHVAERMERTAAFARDEVTGGLTIGEVGTRNITMSAGALWQKLRKLTIAAFNSSTGGTFDIYYRDGAGGFTKVAAATQWPNTQFDDGTGVLATLASNKYAVCWFYLEADDSDIIMLYGRVEHGSVAAAEAEAPPATIPNRITAGARILGKLIFQKSAATASSIYSVFTTSFSTTGASAHSNLSNLDYASAGHTGFATSAQGSLADSALQAAAIGTTVQAYDADLTTWAGITPAAGVATFLATPTSANLLAAVTDETGTGSLVFATSPTFVTPLLGTPTSGALDNCTTNTEADATSDTQLASTAFVQSQSSKMANSKAPSQAIKMTAAASASNGIRSGITSACELGTGNFTLSFEGSLPDYTPSANQHLVYTNTSSKGVSLLITTGGQIAINLYRVGGNITITSSVGVGSYPANTSLKIVAAITRETASVDGSVAFYVNGIQLGTTQAIAYTTAGAGETISNAGTWYVLGTSTVRYAGICQSAAVFNRALSSTDVLDLSLNGIDFVDKWGSQVAQYTSDFSAGADNWVAYVGCTVLGNIDAIAGQDDWLEVTATAASASARRTTSTNPCTVPYKNTRLTLTYYIPVTNTTSLLRVMTQTASAGSATWLSVVPVIGTLTTVVVEGEEIEGLYGVAINTTGNTVGDKCYFKGIVSYSTGAMLALEPEGIQPNPGQWLDSSTNKLHAMQPAAGSSPTRSKREFEFRWTNTWAGTHELQYIGGYNQAVLPTGCYIESITGVITGSVIEDIIIGDGSSGNRFVTITTALATGTTRFTVANPISDGTNYKLTVDPDANMTGSIEWIIRGIIL